MCKLALQAKDFVPILVLSGIFFISLPFIHIRLSLVSRTLVLLLYGGFWTYLGLTPIRPNRAGFLKNKAPLQ